MKWNDLLNEPVSSKHQRQVMKSAYPRRWFLFSGFQLGLGFAVAASFFGVLISKGILNSSGNGLTPKFNDLNSAETVADLENEMVADAELYEDLDLFEDLEIIETWEDS